jgi:hypothetical protein
MSLIKSMEFKTRNQHILLKLKEIERIKNTQSEKECNKTVTFMISKEISIIFIKRLSDNMNFPHIYPLSSLFPNICTLLT